MPNHRLTKLGNYLPPPTQSDIDVEAAENFNQSARSPRNAVVILLDSLNRHMLGAYGGDEFATPNIDSFAAGATRFMRHQSGSLPCIPARHDLLCGALDFLWRPWGSIEVWEDSLPSLISRRGVTSALFSDHPHLFESGGENYHHFFSSWDYTRGGESDPWKTQKDPSAYGAPWLPEAKPSGHDRPWEKSRTYFRREEDFPGPRTMTAAAEWLKANGKSHDRFFLLVDEFDPHEPFDTPAEWAEMYDDSWEGPRLVWPPYLTRAIEDGHLTERQAWHIRANYGGKLSMIDHWFGKIVEALTEQGLWEDTAVILCTDHGHYLGEHDTFGKPSIPIFQTMGLLPLMIHWPGVEAGECDALTSTVDIFATLTDMFDVQPTNETHGRSLIPLLMGEKRSIRDWVLMGIWGREVQIVTDKAKYVAAPPDANAPLSLWSNRWSTMPIPPWPFDMMWRPDRRANLDFMPGSDVPVIRQPFVEGDMLPPWALRDFVGSMAFNLDTDPDETVNVVNEASTSQLRDELRDVLAEVEAPADHLVRLGYS